MTTLNNTAEPEPVPVLTFARTIDRALVHRAAVSEVLVTDLMRTGPEAFLAGAQLPNEHAYFSDHERTPATYDFLLLLEAARQAGTAASHRQLSLPLDTTFLVSNWTVRLEDPQALMPGDRPGELELAGTVTPLTARNGRLRGVTSAAILGIAGRVVARTRIDVGTARNTDYNKLRFLQRRSTPPLTADLLGLERSRPADASGVGRRNPANVVLGEPLHLGNAVAAQVDPLFENRSLFDHTYDHLPAMVLTEAARQLAHLAGVPTDATVTGCTADFLRFAELDSPLVATARLDPAAAGGRIGCSVVFEQDGREAGRIALECTRVPQRTGAEEGTAW
ncbi:AfsA-related hotdog domain-containing protein [Streptomyces purpurogeneiscleroticus]|uniref:AfsA-related hotdog domain-containing protein n=1 Tax=Streptomyces purpurogeneiscleroticus TaxID=68259 RepID=UPI001CBF8096|nr:AfsA-related hotdog domain-containing protein [Streptomyces purpurogeneiscleroticus]